MNRRRKFTFLSHAPLYSDFRIWWPLSDSDHFLSKLVYGLQIQVEQFRDLSVLKIIQNVLSKKKFGLKHDASNLKKKKKKIGTRPHANSYLKVWRHKQFYKTACDWL